MITFTSSMCEKEVPSISTYLGFFLIGNAPIFFHTYDIIIWTHNYTYTIDTTDRITLCTYCTQGNKGLHH